MIRGQYPALNERMKTLKSKTLENDLVAKVYCDDDYELESLTLQQEQSLGKLELDNKTNESKAKRSTNALLLEQRVQGAHQTLQLMSTESKALIDNWIRRNTSHWYVDQKFSCVTDVEL